MADSIDYKALYLQAEEEKRQEAELRRRAEQGIQRTTFKELVQHCHNLLSRPLRAEEPSRSTTGKIPVPTGKYCPLRLEHWTDCSARQRAVYDLVRDYLQPPGEDAPRLFSPLIALEDYGRRIAHRPISSEQDLETYERIAVEDHVQGIISELCKISDARDKFRLGDGIRFDNRRNALDEVEGDESRPPRPDQYCIPRVDDSTNSLLTTVEYKPPHKLPVETLRVGLQPIDFHREIVE